MSLVSHDSIWPYHYGVPKEPKNDTDEDEKNKARERVSEDKATKEIENNNTNTELSKKVDESNCGKVTETKKTENNELSTKNGTNAELLLERHITGYKQIIKTNDKILYLSENTGDVEPRKRRSHNNDGSNKYKNKISTNQKTTLDKDKEIEDNYKNKFARQALKKDGSQNEVSSQNLVRNKTKKSFQKKKCSRLKGNLFLEQYCASNAPKRINKKWQRSKLRLSSGVLISLVMMNVAGLSSAVDTSSFSSALTSRMIASFLGYPSTCTLGSEVRPCTLTLTCWLRGGTRQRGCGGWLFSCCGLPEPSRDNFDNSIPSSEWKYKPPTKLRQVPQRSVVPNNVFRRRVDDDVTQMDCGLPSSRILQKRIIGGREARFAEFPWQAHVRISEFQCGGVLVSRRYVATAAHCVSRAHTRDIAVWLGAIDTSATHHPARKLGVVQKILHPLFQFRMTQPDRYDIALLKLSRSITYMSNILPICLPDHDMDLRGRSGVIAGWGKTDASNGHTGTNLLRSATVPILSKEQCINWHQSKQISVEIHSEMICAGHSDGHQDACLGDSGGPLIVLDNGRYYLVGITSAGFGCGVDHQPGIYHNVKLTANWIKNVISPAANYNDNYLN